MLTLTDEQLDWLEKRVPDAAMSPLGGRPPMDKRTALRGIFWILDNGAKWKDLPREFGSKSAVHRWFTEWVSAGVFEDILNDAGQLVEERDGYRLYECFIDGTFCKARGGGERTDHAGPSPHLAVETFQRVVRLDASTFPRERHGAQGLQHALAHDLCSPGQLHRLQLLDDRRGTGHTIARFVTACRAVVSCAVPHPEANMASRTRPKKGAHQRSTAKAVSPSAVRKTRQTIRRLEGREPSLDRSMAQALADAQRLQTVATKATRKQHDQLTRLVAAVSDDLRRLRTGVLEIQKLVDEIEAAELARG